MLAALQVRILSAGMNRRNMLGGIKAEVLVSFGKHTALTEPALRERRGTGGSSPLFSFLRRGPGCLRHDWLSLSSRTE